MESSILATAAKFTKNIHFLVLGTLLKLKRSEYPLLLILALLRFPILLYKHTYLGSCLYFGRNAKWFPCMGTLFTIYLPGTLRIESSPKTTPSPRVTNTFRVKDIFSLSNQFIIEHRWYSQTDLTQIRRDHIKLASLNNVHLLANVALPADKIPRGEHLHAGTVLLLTPWNTEYER